MENIIFVDEDDNIIGTGTRNEALEKGIIHRIVGVFLFNSKGELLIQKRSQNVDLPGRWDRSVGGHVDEGETYFEAAVREMKEEIGLEDVALVEVGKSYIESPQKKQVKKFFDTVYTASYDGEIRFDPKEVAEVKWISMNELEGWAKSEPQALMRGLMYWLSTMRQRGHQ